MTTDDIPAGLTAWLPGFVADELRPDMIDDWVRRTSASILDELPELAASPDLVGVLYEAVRAQWLAFLAAFTQPNFQFHLVEGGVKLARELAAHQLPLEVLIKVYRAAQQESWTYVTGVVRAIPSQDIDHAAVLIHFWSRASSWIDQSIGASIDIYQTERTRRLQGASAQRYEVVKALLNGESAESRRVAASRRRMPTLWGIWTRLPTMSPGCSGVVGRSSSIREDVSYGRGWARERHPTWTRSRRSAPA